MHVWTRVTAGLICAVLLFLAGAAVVVQRPNRAGPAAAPAAVAQEAPIRIMPLGDSITYGNPYVAYGGYRHVLGAALAKDGYSAQFVGSQQSGNGALPDPDNEGHPGWTIRKLQDGIDANGWLETYQPDVVLLHIGTNDMNKSWSADASARLTALLDDILARLPRARVVVAQIIPARSGSDAAARAAYNAAIPPIVAAAGPRVSLVDMRAILSHGDYADDLHPNDRGYDKMARAWEPAILAALRAMNDAPPPAARSSAAR